MYRSLSLVAGLLLIACSPRPGSYEGWFEVREVGLVPEYGPPSLALELADEEVTFELLDVARAHCSWDDVGATITHYFDRPQTFDATAPLEGGGFSVESTVSVSGDRPISLTGDWVAPDRVEGELTVSMEQDCKGGWVACLEGSDCSRPELECDEDQREQVDSLCDWAAGSDNCFEDALVAVQLCFPDEGAQGELTSPNTCLFDDGTSIDFTEPVDGDESLVSFEVFDPNGAWCMGFDQEIGQMGIGGGTLRSAFGDYGWQSHREATDALEDGQLMTWSCPGDCGYETVYDPMFTDTSCDDRLLPGASAWEGENSVTLRVGSGELPLGGPDTDEWIVFECE